MSLIYADMRECQDHLLARFMAGTAILQLMYRLQQNNPLYDGEYLQEIEDGLDSLWDLMDAEQQRLARLHSSNLNKAFKEMEE